MSNGGADAIDWGALGAWFGPETHEYHLDPDDPFEAGVWAALHGDGTRIDELALAWADLLDRAGDDEEAFLDPLQPLSPVPAGGSWLQWGRYVATFIGRATSCSPEFPKDHAAGRGQPSPTPVTTFLNQRVAERAVTETLTRHAAALREWCTDPMAPARLHVYAELDGPVGQAFAVAGPLRATSDAREAVTGCAVVVGRAPCCPDPEVLAAFPERSFDGCHARERWPELPAVFGGYFGQRYPSLDHDTWAAERALNEQLSEPARARLGDQLAQLLEVDDETLRGAIEELGSYVVPLEPRRWVTGLGRRMLEVDWTRPDGDAARACPRAFAGRAIEEIRR